LAASRKSGGGPFAASGTASHSSPAAKDPRIDASPDALRGSA
jgi:hypothetical protein